jgi:hypothetical protein
MLPDYPAAHSMDTYWFAVDHRGQVAVFVSGEPGHVPEGADNDIFRDLYFLYLGDEEEYENDWEPEKWSEQMGLTFYIYSSDYGMLVRPYERTVRPDVPLHVGMLPHDLREQCREHQFEELAFDETEFIQPLDYFPCILYYEQDVAYLAADGVTVRPVPGKESEFADFVRQWREADPERAARLRFEGLGPPAGQE